MCRFVTGLIVITLEEHLSISDAASPLHSIVFSAFTQNLLLYSSSRQTQHNVCSAQAPVICHELPKKGTYFLIFLQRKLNCNNCALVLEEPACRENFLCSSTGRLYYSPSLSLSLCSAKSGVEGCWWWYRGQMGLIDQPKYATNKCATIKSTV